MTDRNGKDHCLFVSGPPCTGASCQSKHIGAERFGLKGRSTYAAKLGSIFSPSFLQHVFLVHPVSAQTVVPASFTKLYLFGHLKLEQTTSEVLVQT